MQSVATHLGPDFWMHVATIISFVWFAAKCGHLPYPLMPALHVQARGVPVHRLVHEEGSFVITFPNAYHSGFNTGAPLLACSKAAYLLDASCAAATCLMRITSQVGACVAPSHCLFADPAWDVFLQVRIVQRRSILVPLTGCLGGITWATSIARMARLPPCPMMRCWSILPRLHPLSSSAWKG